MIKIEQNGEATDFVFEATAGEDIAAGDAVCIVPADGVESQNYSPSIANTDQDVAIGSSEWAAQAFTTSAIARGIGRLRVYLSESNGSGNISFTVRIRSTLTGSDIWSANNSDFGGVGWQEFTPNIAVSPSTTYYVIVDGGGANQLHWYADSAAPYAGHVPYISNDSGASWTAQSGYDHSLQIKELIIDQGRIAKASALRDDARFHFVGFAQEAISAGAVGLVNPLPLVPFLSGLTIGAEYYLSDTHGEISTTPGTNSRKVGNALSATVLARVYPN